MAVTITKSPNRYSFIGNSIVFELSTETKEPVEVEIVLKGISKQATYYPFKVTENLYKIRMEISDYLDYDTKLDITEGIIISPLSGFSLPYQVKIGSDYIFDGIAFRGGVSNHIFKKLEEKHFDIFTYRLTSYSEQFLFTTRTNRKEITINKTELFPFVFIHPGIPIIFRSDSGTEISGDSYPAGTICLMDIRAVLDQMPEGTNRVDVCPAGQYAFHFNIIQENSIEEKYFIRFKNSLGAFEILEITGRATYVPEFLEENNYNQLTEFDFYEELRSRVKSKGVIEVETGHKLPEEFPFIIDMIKSDEIYFLLPDGDSFRCNIKSDSAQYRNLMTDPTSIKLKVIPVTTEEFYGPDVFFEKDGDYKTEIAFEVSIDSSNVNSPVTLLSLNGNPTETFMIDYGDGIKENLHFLPLTTISTGEPGTPFYYEYEDSPLISHIYTKTGTYRINIYSESNISWMKFTLLGQPQTGEWVKSPIQKNHITRLIKAKSNSIRSLNYAFAGLDNCVPDIDFVLETPMVTSMFATFHTFGKNVNLRDPDGWSFNPDLLSRITRTTQLNNTFRSCRMRNIPIGFFNNKENVTTLFETFKFSYLGYKYFDGYTQDEFIRANMEGTAFIPSNLLWDMPNLVNMKACFNSLYNGYYRDYGALRAGTFGNWHNLTLLIKAEFFWNGKNKGNPLGTIQNLSYTFGKLNQFSIEKDVFRYIKNSLVDISAVFYEANRVHSSSISQSVFFNFGGQGSLAEEFTRMTTMNIKPMLGTGVFPNVKFALNAFCAGTLNFGFNGIFGSDPTIAMCSIANSACEPSVTIDNTICSYFPAIERSSGIYDTVWSYQTGLDGMMHYLRLLTSEVTPNPDLIRANTENPITY